MRPMLQESRISHPAAWRGRPCDPPLSLREPAARMVNPQAARIAYAAMAGRVLRELITGALVCASLAALIAFIITLAALTR